MKVEQAMPRLSALAALFPRGVVCAELAGAGRSDELLPVEAAHVARAVETRREEFAAGRACARRALSELGVTGFALEAAEDRRPIWPAQIVGSITHTRGFCAAVVALKSTVRALGIDTERVGSVKPELWPRVCGPELKWLEGLTEAERFAAATLIFCIKEAFYKCQYTLTEQYLGFSDVRIELSDPSSQAGEYSVHACRPIALAEQLTVPLRGRYMIHQEFVTAAAAVPVQ